MSSLNRIAMAASGSSVGGAIERGTIQQFKKLLRT
jgi:hypothetical protein